MNKAKIKKITGTVTAAVLVVVLCVAGIIISDSRIPDRMPDNAYRAVFFDVGEADCVLYHGKDAAILTDAPANQTDTVTGYMERIGIKRLDYFIISHYDKDHAGDAVRMIEKFKPYHILLPEPVGNKDEIYGEIVKITDEKQRITAKTGQSYTAGGVVIDVLAPNNRGNENNDMCIVCRIAHKDTSLLMCSDIDTDDEKVILSKYGDKIRSDVLKVAHHGSRYSSSDAFIGAVSPQYAVISCGPNTYGHPDTGVMNRLRAAKASVLTTQTDGVIIFDFFEDRVVKVK